MLYLVYIKIKGEIMSKKNIMFFIVIGLVINIIMEIGIICSFKDLFFEESNIFMNILENVDDSNLKIGNIDEIFEKF